MRTLETHAPALQGQAIRHGAGERPREPLPSLEKKYGQLSQALETVERSLGRVRQNATRKSRALTSAATTEIRPSMFDVGCSLFDVLCGRGADSAARCPYPHRIRTAQGRAATPWPPPDASTPPRPRPQPPRAGTPGQEKCYLRDSA